MTAQLPPHTADLLELFAITGTDSCDYLSWRVTYAHEDPPNTLRFLVNCSDTYAWATADCEPVEPDDIPLLKQALEDCRAADPKYGDSYFTDLWISRKRGMRPMRLWLGTHPGQKDGVPKGLKQRHPELLPLFLAAGPEREPRSEG